MHTFIYMQHNIIATLRSHYSSYRVPFGIAYSSLLLPYLQTMFFLNSAANAENPNASVPGYFAFMLRIHCWSCNALS